MKKNIKKAVAGFTLIELIVVIAMIAILAAIILVNVITYIGKSKDASMQEELHTVQTDLLSSSIGSNGLAIQSATPCSGDAWNAILKTQTGAGKAVCDSNATGCSTSNGVLTCTNPGTLFCACVQATAVTANYYCVDASGKNEITTTPCLANCGTNGTYTCPQN